MYTIDSTTGLLTPNKPSTVTAGNGAYPIALDAAGGFAYVGNQNANTVSIYKINSKGILASAGLAQTGNDPIAIALTR
jgi:DNA-binding beta-propeller fold protein YncE